MIGPNIERGFSLIEMMIAMTIGMILMVAVAQLFYGNRQTSAAQDAAAGIQETARFAALILQREIRMAGMKRTESTGTFDAANPMITGTNATVGAPNASDEVTVRFWGSDNAAGTAADNTVVDCLGNGVRLNQRVVDRFHIANNASGEPSLFCQNTNPANGVVTDNELVPGVESMQILAGIDTDADKVPNAYLQFNDPAMNLDQVIALLREGCCCAAATTSFLRPTQTSTTTSAPCMHLPTLRLPVMPGRCSTRPVPRSTGACAACMARPLRSATESTESDESPDLTSDPVPDGRARCSPDHGAHVPHASHAPRGDCDDEQHLGRKNGTRHTRLQHRIYSGGSRIAGRGKRLDWQWIAQSCFPRHGLLVRWISYVTMPSHGPGRGAGHM